MNAIQLLKDDHKKLRGLLAELEATTKRASKKRSELLPTIAREFEFHATLEEEMFYPAFKKAGDKGEDEKLYFEALEEHRAAGDMVLSDLQKTAPDSDQFSGRAKVLKEIVERHLEKEEKQMFLRARELMTASELRLLGERMAERKLELASGGKAISAVKRAGDRLMGAITSAIGPEPTPTQPGRSRGNGGQRAGNRSSSSRVGARPRT